MGGGQLAAEKFGFALDTERRTLVCVLWIGRQEHGDKKIQVSWA